MNIVAINAVGQGFYARKPSFKSQNFDCSVKEKGEVTFILSLINVYNALLNSPNPKDKVQRERIEKVLDDFFAKLPPISRSMTFYRGVDFDKNSRVRDYFDKLERVRVGDTVVEDRYLYAAGALRDIEEYSKGYKTAKNPEGKSVALSIVVPEGSKVLRYNREGGDACLLPKRSEFEILNKGIHENNRMFLVYKLLNED